ncbi:MAG: AAA family ATPase [Thermoguttaceae bacterium]|nr:AAA family ATPase [Thermoguttaceae bacterium]
MDEGNLLDGELQKRTSAIAYGISRALGELCRDRAILEAQNEWFDIQQYAGAGHCSVAGKPGVHSQIETQWPGPGEGMPRRDCTAWLVVTWRDHAIEVVTASWRDFPQCVRWQWIVAETMEIAEGFFDAVCEWCHETRGEVLVFSEGTWEKSAELFRAIAATSFESLVLQGSMKEELRQDFESFLASRHVYEQYGVPWKRGALFLGPPGNGKTHCVKALVNALDVPCLYVQSFKACYSSEQSGIKAVFQRARKSNPCLLVLEDVDALVTPESRAFFLNELDGFADNAGIITIATSNHPERLDPSILERPSRFDRKYRFEPPGAAERAAYLALWHDRTAVEMRLSSEEMSQVVEWTDGFSFAYLKELIVSSLTSWMSSRVAGGMGRIMREQAMKLREQMGREADDPAPASPALTASSGPGNDGHADG